MTQTQQAEAKAPKAPKAPKTPKKSKFIFLITPDGASITRFRNAAKANEAKNAAPEGTVAVVQVKDLQNLDPQVLVDIHNRGVDEDSQVAKFMDQAAAAAAVWPYLEPLSEDGQPKPTKAEKQPAAPRPSKLTGKFIYRNQAENPRKADTLGHAAWEAIVDGMTYEDYIKATSSLKGGGYKHLIHDIKRGRITLSDTTR